MFFVTLIIVAVLVYFLAKSFLAKGSNQDSGVSAAKTQDGQLPLEKNSAPTAPESTMSSAKTGTQLADSGVDTGNVLKDVQEMIKILNLAPSDASRLSISREAFSALRAGNNTGSPSTDELNVAATKLRKMLA